MSLLRVFATGSFLFANPRKAQYAFLDMWGSEGWQAVAKALVELGGYFTFKDAVGHEFVIMRKEDFVPPEDTEGADRQLSLPAAPAEPLVSAEDVLERINRDIAIFQLHQDEEIEEEEGDDDMEPPRRVRFEPLRGDLPPELQE
jgi:hypothetical protein